MSEDQQPQSPESEAPQPMGPGQLLKNARLARHLTLEQVASRLYLKASLLDQLENDHYDQAISMTFIKGYLKLYARQVGVTEAEILDALDTLNMQKKEPAKLQSFSRRVAHQANDDKLMLVTYLILGAVVALVVVWWFQQDNKDPLVVGPQITADTAEQSADISDASTKNSVPDTSAQPDANGVVTERFVPQPATPTLQQSDDITSTDTDDGSPEPVDEISEPQSAQPLPGMDTTTPSTAVEGQQKVQLVFEFSDDCWMRLTDATGEDIAYGVKVAGRVMTVSGVPPFNVILGAPSAVKINYSGEDLDMSKFNASQTAEFSLPLIQ
ncbi:MAG: cytoskeleton protein RodZ [Paraglaciecola sp.]|jgi:cytoskeleton protein RodZ